MKNSEIGYLMELLFYQQVYDNPFPQSNKKILIEMKKGLRMVRGAYISEEDHIAKKRGIESPVCEGIEKTQPDSADHCCDRGCHRRDRVRRGEGQGRARAQGGERDASTRRGEQSVGENA